MRFHFWGPLKYSGCVVHSETCNINHFWSLQPQQIFFPIACSLSCTHNTVFLSLVYRCSHNLAVYEKVLFGGKIFISSVTIPLQHCTCCINYSMTPRQAVEHWTKFCLFVFSGLISRQLQALRLCKRPQGYVEAKHPLGLNIYRSTSADDPDVRSQQTFASQSEF